MLIFRCVMYNHTAVWAKTVATCFFDVWHQLSQGEGGYTKESSPMTAGSHGDKHTSALAHSNSSELLDLVREATTCCGIKWSSVLSLCFRRRQAVIRRVQHLLCRRGPHHWRTPGALLLHWWPAKQVSWNCFHYNYFFFWCPTVLLWAVCIQNGERRKLYTC